MAAAQAGWTQDSTSWQVVTHAHLDHVAVLALVTRRFLEQMVSGCHRPARCGVLADTIQRT